MGTGWIEGHIGSEQPWGQTECAAPACACVLDVIASQFRMFVIDVQNLSEFFTDKLSKYTDQDSHKS